MFWDRAAGLYDLFENVYNGKVNHELPEIVGSMIGPEDNVLECACGTGMISEGIAPRCRKLLATDYSEGMLVRAKRRLMKYPNVKVRSADIMQICSADGEYDKVVAGNVVHLLDKPYDALAELLRVCKPGGKIIIPTYVNNENNEKHSLFIKLIEKFGAGFKQQFDYESYKQFFKEGGFDNVEYSIIEGKMPCAIAVITKKYAGGNIQGI